MLSPQVLAQRADCSLDLIYAAIKSGDLPASNIGGQLRATYRVHEEDFEAFLEGRRVRPPAILPRRRRKQMTSTPDEFFP